MKIRISPLCVLFLPALILMPQTALPFLCAVLVHECGHLTFCLLYDLRVKSIRVALAGLEICCDKSMLGYQKDFFLSLSGCFFNLISAALYFALFGEMGMFVLCSLLLCAFNLLPVKKSDGGCALYDITALLFSEAAARAVLAFFSSLSVLILFALSAYLLFFGKNGFFLFLSVIYMFTTLFIKR